MKEESQKRTSALSKLALAIAAIIWGFGFIAVQLALDSQFSSAAIMFGRFGVGAMLIFLTFFKGIIQNIKREHLLSGFAIGFLLFAAFMVQTLGQKYSTPSNIALITGSNVVMVPFLWWAVSKQRPLRITFIASFFCLFGISLLSVDFSNGFSLYFGDLLTLLAAFLFACQITATGALAPKMDFRVLVFLQLTVAALCSLVTFLVADGDFSIYLAPKGLAAILYLGALSTCACYILQTAAQKHVDSSTAAVILSTESLFGAFFSVLTGYDKLTFRLIFGGAIVFFSVIMPDLWLRKNAAALSGEDQESKINN